MTGPNYLPDVVGVAMLEIFCIAKTSWTSRVGLAVQSLEEGVIDRRFPGRAFSTCVNAYLELNWYAIHV